MNTTGKGPGDEHRGSATSVTLGVATWSVTHRIDTSEAMLEFSDKDGRVRVVAWMTKAQAEQLGSYMATRP